MHKPRRERSFSPHSFLMGGLLGVLCLMLVPGCENDLTEPPGVTVSGRVFYEGDAHVDFAEPALVVILFADWPPQGPPHAKTTIRNPDFSTGEGVAYQMPLVVPYSYFALAELVDLADPELPSVPTGAYPNYCVLSDDAPVVVGEEDVMGIDFTLYDLGGAEDPCNDVEVSICPEAGKATLQLEVLSQAQIEANDTLVFAAWDAWPAPGAPLLSKTIPAADLTFPFEYLDNTIDPGGLALYFCLDKGGDVGRSLCDDSDVWAVFDGGALVDFEGNMVHSLSLDLDDGTSEVVAVRPAAELGCGDVGPATIDVELIAPDITPVAGDSVSVSLFEAYPPAGPPAHYATSAVDSFPVTLSISDVPPGDYYVHGCYDAGGDSPTCDGAGDVQYWYMDGAEAVTLPGGATTQIAINLAGGATTGSIVVNVDSASLSPANNDRLRVALFTSFPPAGPPAVSGGLNPITAFPATAELNDVEPGDYFLFVCFDVDGDNSGCDGAGDVSYWHADGATPLTVAAASTQTIDVSLDPPPNTLLEVIVESSELTPGTGDTVSASLFTSFPPTGPPNEYEAVALTSFPTTIPIAEPTAGDYYLLVCLDAGGDSPQCNGAGDMSVPYRGGTEVITIVDGEYSQVTVRLDPSIEVVIDSATLTPGANDRLSVSAFTSFPPAGPPTLSASIDAPTFPAELLLSPLAAGDYYLIACLDVDGDSPTCNGAGDVQLAYMGGQQAVTVGVGASHASMVMDALVEATLTGETVSLGANDTVSLSAFSTFPPTGPPVASTRETATGFPQTLTLPLIAGDYYLTACLDVGGDSPTCNGAGDLQVWYLDGATTVGASLGQVSSVDVSFDSSLSVAIGSTTITPGASDTLSVSTFTAYPPAGPPAASTSAALTAFPQTVTIPVLAPGDYYVVVCYDAGGDTPTCNGAGDIQVWYQDGATALTVAAVEAAQITMDVDLPTTIDATVESSTITPLAGDQLALSVFPTFPPTGPPSGSVRVDATSFPQVVSLGGLAAGDYYVHLCYDEAGDSPLCDGANDVEVWLQGGASPLTVTFGQSHPVTMTVDR